MLLNFLEQTLQCNVQKLYLCTFFAHQNMKNLSSKVGYFSKIAEIFNILPRQFFKVSTTFYKSLLYSNVISVWLSRWYICQLLLFLHIARVRVMILRQHLLLARQDIYSAWNVWALCLLKDLWRNGRNTPLICIFLCGFFGPWPFIILKSSHRDLSNKGSKHFWVY